MFCSIALVAEHCEAAAGKVPVVRTRTSGATRPTQSPNPPPLHRLNANPEELGSGCGGFPARAEPAPRDRVLWGTINSPV